MFQNPCGLVGVVFSTVLVRRAMATESPGSSGFVAGRLCKCIGTSSMRPDCWHKFFDAAVKG